MKTVTMTVSDEFHAWLEGALDTSTQLDGMGFKIDSVKRDATGQICCDAIFQAAQQCERFDSVRSAISRQDADHTRRVALMTGDRKVTWLKD